MAKNNKFINQQKMLAKKINDVVPKTYAAMALALSHTWEKNRDEIIAMFAESQRLWQECADNDIDMIKWCDDELDIDCFYGTTAPEGFEE